MSRQEKENRDFFFKPRSSKGLRQVQCSGMEALQQGAHPREAGEERGPEFSFRQKENGCGGPDRKCTVCAGWTRGNYSSLGKFLSEIWLNLMLRMEQKG